MCAAVLEQWAYRFWTVKLIWRGVVRRRKSKHSQTGALQRPFVQISKRSVLFWLAPYFVPKSERRLMQEWLEEEKVVPASIAVVQTVGALRTLEWARHATMQEGGLTMSECTAVSPEEQIANEVIAAAR